MSLVSFYCDSCNFYNLSQCRLYLKVYFIVNFIILNVPDDGLSSETSQTVFKENTDSSKHLCVILPV